jgi:RNA polymerase sigma-70 factor (ECF subfamily)
VAFRNFSANARDRERAKKRGGGRLPLRIDADAAETLYAPEPADPRTPDREFERRWALTVLARALERLAGEQARAGKQPEFEALRPWLVGGGAEGGYARLAGALGRHEGALKVAVHRLRRRYGELLREEVAGTLDDPGQVEAELAALMEALGP